MIDPMKTGLLSILVAAGLLAAAPSSLHALDLILPTRNANIYEHPEEFYMRTVRSGEDAWKGGTYGFSRNARNIGGEVLYTRFHEGVDIAPMMRDAGGEPLDSVVAIDTGTVVYVNSQSGRSNYGKYIVVRHVWEGSPYYSLYAHLNETWVDSGMHVPQGFPLGRLGYTGAGINRARAHLHFEITMLVNWNFQQWYDGVYRNGRNYHGYYNGINLAGLDVARLYQRLNEEPDLSIEQFVAEEHPPFYRVLFPRDGRLDLLWRYPWLLKESVPAEHSSWEVTFDASGLPLQVVGSDSVVDGPVVSWVAETPHPYSYLTKSRLTGRRGSAELSGSGRRFIDLLAEEPDSATYVALVEEGVLESGMEHEGELVAARKAYLRELAEQQRARERAGRGPAVIQPGQPVEPEGADDDQSQVVTEVELTPEERSSSNRSIMHTGGHSFICIINGERWRIELRPIVVRREFEDDDIDGAGVDTLRAICPSCGDFGIAQPVLRRIDEVSWGISLEVEDRRKMAANVKQLHNRIFDIPLLIVSEGEYLQSLVQVRMVLKKG